VASHWPVQGIELEFFDPSEFKHPELMAPAFLEILDAWRRELGFALIVHSDGRTPQELEALYAPNAPPDSAHLRGCAVDVTPAGDTQARRLHMARVALDMWQAGDWPHLGLEVATAHIHVDSDPKLAAEGRRPALFAGVSR
jgi:hypothetical protein